MQDDRMIRVLGPIDVMTPSGSIAVGGRQARALLGALVIGVDHAVTIDHLQDVLWGDEPPDSADNTLQSYVSHLRQTLGADVIAHVDHSYELIADTQHIDALRFESLLTRAVESRDDAEVCRARCDEAIQLWRGRPFGDLADEEAFKLEAYRLDELLLATMELRLEADLALGHHELIVGELEAAVDEHPYRERLWFLLIEALAASGRRVESLRQCTRLRTVLAEVGIEPGNELAELEQRILENGLSPTTPNSSGSVVESQVGSSEEARCGDAG